MNRLSRRLSFFGRRDSSQASSSRQPEPSIPPPIEEQIQEQAPPPSYTVENQRVIDEIDLTAAFENLRLDNGPHDPNSERCLAHLKLLFTIQTMKEEVGYTDGLFGLWDSLAGPIDELVPPGSPDTKKEKGVTVGDELQKILRDRIFSNLSLMREKRWALYVARAVDRYETWWKTLPGKPLTEFDMETPGSTTYADFPSDVPMLLFGWNEENLPPLDVLMVWHTHMLNPRAYLEDCMLAGLRSLWLTGMPWSAVNQVIDNNFAYKVSDRAKADWTKSTGLAWDNADEPMVKTVNCPHCEVPNEIPWTTCGISKDYRGRIDDDVATNLVGHGYGDGELHHPCVGAACGIVIQRQLLCVAKFVKDFKSLLGPESRPMPGTILDPVTGKPQHRPLRSDPLPRTFPNQMLKSGVDEMRICFMDLLTTGLDRIPDLSMKHVRTKIEMVLKSGRNIREITGRRATLDTIARISIRKMMSRYWDNHSLFALDLAGGVMRQGVFIEKMYKLDWLHSPSARDTMKRLLVKYERFMSIVVKGTWEKKIAVPTLDVDLAWHTHQLSPSAYYTWTVRNVNKFLDHDDKIDEGTLNKQFEWTSKQYQERYNEVYSECTCWYCESIRSTHISSIGSALRLSNNESIAETFHTSGRATQCSPTNSAHISAHNAVTAHSNLNGDNTNTTVTQRVKAQLAALQQKRLENAYAKVCARSAKQGRKPPERETYYDHWGFMVPYQYPYMYAVWWYPGMYYGYPPMAMTACGNGWGDCASGTCGGGVASGGCGGCGGG
ncbi:hypothetical protein QBC38DRAFT_45740 [Podospora fimiseda]|uniref:Uncharacterized protein n=1 Tax=Podospora fimiseda TaxID=252190 RepID=A0AAN7BHM5_9PEZI|nr:hypothetical protein QBC38DRAFT_45740 [Podospora fimiseda]